MTDSKCRVPELEEELDMETAGIIAKHPCFNREASHTFGRVHLAVAPECNIQCNFCLREFDCVNESLPGVTSQLLTPTEALDRVERVMRKFEHIQTVGIAGPGEPLFNEETFETFHLVRRKFPEIHLCLSSNGLLLPDRVNMLHDLGVETVTVTVNAVDPKIGQYVCSWVCYGGTYYRDIQGADLLLSKQLEGIRLAVERGMLVKINTVMIPTVNDHHLEAIARKAQELGAFMQNIMPMIPQYKFAHLKPPSAGAREEAQDKCSEHIRQMRHCRQCRADDIGLLGKDLRQKMFETAKLESERAEQGFKVAVTSSSTNGRDIHFAKATQYLIYEVQGDRFRLLEARDAELQKGKKDIAIAAELLSDCTYLVTRKADPEVIHELSSAGIEVVEGYHTINPVASNLVQHTKDGTGK